MILAIILSIYLLPIILGLIYNYRHSPKGATIDDVLFNAPEEGAPWFLPFHAMIIPILNIMLYLTGMVIWLYEEIKDIKIK